MTCEKCGCATIIVEQSGGIKEGEFKEKYECANGHVGFIRGKAEQPARSWSRTGTVFNSP